MEFTFETRIDAPPGLLEDWHHRAGALARLLPPDGSARVVESSFPLVAGGLTTLRVRLAPGVERDWVAEHTVVRRGEGFTDVQVKGPFGSWTHRHRFLPDPEDAGKSILRDEISCEPPGGVLGRWWAGPVVGRRLCRLFAWRHGRTKLDVESLHGSPPPRPLHVLVSGASGLLGSGLVPFLLQAGHHVTTLGRHAHGPNARVWDPARGHIDIAGLPPIDAVVHLAGENVAAGRWTAKRRRSIIESRERGTRLLAEAIARLDPKPQALVCASGASIYRADGRVQREDAAPDTATFLGQVVQAWERAAEPARQAGIRTVHLRLGVVLAAQGGALARMLPVFRCGLGGRLGNGRAALSWISLDDVLELFHRACWDERFDWAINAVSPNVVSNREFTSALAGVLHRPALVPVPAMVLHGIFGLMAEETVLADLRVEPARLAALGHGFRFPLIEGALRQALMR